jgi:hypothetical protein
MNSAIRAQRQRGNVPRSMLPPEDEPAPAAATPAPVAPEPEAQPEPEPAEKKSFFERIFGRP